MDGNWHRDAQFVIPIEADEKQFLAEQAASGLYTCPGPPGRLSALSIYLCKSVFYGAFVWARRALNIQKRRFPARAVSAGIQMQIALVANDDVQLVPGSHARWDSAAEYDVRCADGRVRAGVAQDPFPGGPLFAARILDI